MTDEQTKLVPFEGALGSPQKFEKPTVDGMADAIVEKVQILTREPKKVENKEFTLKDGTKVSRRAESAFLRVTYKFADNAKDTKGKQLNKSGFETSENFGCTIYYDDFNGQPFAVPEVFVTEPPHAKAGAGGRLLKLCKEFYGKDNCKGMADVPKLLTGAKVKVRNEPTINPSTSTLGPKAVIAAIVG